MAKRQAKIYIIADSPLYNKRTVEEMMELQLALNKIRALCFSSNYLNRIRDNEESLDWNTKNCVISGLMEACDAIAVIGKTVTEAMLEEIKLAIKLGKTICVVPEIFNKIEIPIENHELISVCNEILE